MSYDLGIRHEDKSDRERRAPLGPGQVRRLVETGLRVAVVPSPQRVFADEEYAAAGADLVPDLEAAGARLIVGLKEVPLASLIPGRPHLFFAHVIKGQPYNMDLLRRMLDLSITLLDYECIRDEEGQRLIAFSRQAGNAGMIDALWALGQRLAEVEGLPTPFTSVRRAFEYRGLAEAKAELRETLGGGLEGGGLPEAIHPAVIGTVGSGRVYKGAREILDCLPTEAVKPEDLPGLMAPAGRADLSRKVIYTVHFQRRHRKELARYLDHLTVLVNAVYWEEGHPRIVSRQDVERLWPGEGDALPRLRVIADISCDIRGGVEVTEKATQPDEPAYVYEAATGKIRDGLHGRGPVVLPVDIFPSELPRDSSQYFGERLLKFLPGIAAADFGRPFAALDLAPELLRAVITHQGALTPDYAYLGRYLE